MGNIIGNKKCGGYQCTNDADKVIGKDVLLLRKQHGLNPYCLRCLCAHIDCNYPRHLIRANRYYAYCERHLKQCIDKSCSNCAIGITDKCAGHSCRPGCQNEVVDNGVPGSCEQHRCQIDGGCAYSSRQMSSSIYCINHICNVVGCNNGAKSEQNSLKFCSKHKCCIEGCYAFNDPSKSSISNQKLGIACPKHRCVQCKAPAQARHCAKCIEAYRSTYPDCQTIASKVL